MSEEKISAALVACVEIRRPVRRIPQLSSQSNRGVHPRTNNARLLCSGFGKTRAEELATTRCVFPFFLSTNFSIGPLTSLSLSFVKTLPSPTVIATLGPACRDVETLKDMLEAGMSCARVDLTVSR